MTHKMKLYNKYLFTARYLPTVVCIVPILFIYFYLVAQYPLYDPGSYFAKMHYFIDVPVSVVLLYFSSTIIRMIGKWLEDIVFHRKDGLPTTYLMLFSSTHFPASFKQQYRARVKQKYDLELLDQASEQMNKAEAVKLLNIATRYLATAYNTNEQVERHNTWYGFSRNMAGGSFISLGVSLIGVATGIGLHDKPLIVWMTILTLFYTGVLLVHLQGFRKRAVDYANTIIPIFMRDV
jgi:hypothetical protein